MPTRVSGPRKSAARKKTSAKQPAVKRPVAARKTPANKPAKKPAAPASKVDIERRRADRNTRERSHRLIDKGDPLWGLHGGLGPPEDARAPEPEFFATPLGRADEELAELWRTDGFARYAGGLFWTVDPREFVAAIADWPAIPNEAVVFARDAFGDLFYLHAGEVGMLDVRLGLTAKLGPSAHIFVNSTVKTHNFQEAMLAAPLFARVRKRLGDLQADECYGMAPAMQLGGDSTAVKSYRRVKLREYLALCSQL